MAIEQLGFPIDLTKGNHNGTELVNGVLKLVSTGVSGNVPIYPLSGYWESNIIDLLDNFTDYGNLVYNRLDTTNASVVISTSTSDDGITFDTYVPLNMSGKISSVKRLFIKVKIELFAGYGNVLATLTDFNSTDKPKWNTTPYVEFNGSLKLKRNYSEVMVKDNTWTGTGTLLRHTIDLDELRKIDTIDILK